MNYQPDGMYFDQGDVWGSTNFGLETMGLQWVVDFDALPGVGQALVGFDLTCAMAANDPPEQGELRIRLDGTLSGFDGTVWYDQVFQCSQFAVQTKFSVTSFLARPVGAHLIKFTTQVVSTTSSYRIDNIVFALRGLS